MKKLTLNSNTSLINKYDCKLSIDTIHLSATLDDKQREYIYDRFLFNKNSPSWHWHYSQNETKELGFSIQALPNNSYTYKHYDHMIQLQKQVTTADDIPYSLAEIINNIDWNIKRIDWNIKRIDFAFDFKTPLEKSLIMKHHGNLQFEPPHDKWDTQYLGKIKTRSSAKVAHYDRNVKESERETDIEHEYFNRYEVRLFPACNDETMELHNMKDDFILKHLSKYIIIPNIDDLPISKWDKNRLYKIKDDNTYTYFKSLDKKKQKELKAITKAHRVPLEQIYLEHKHSLFQFIEAYEDDFIAHSDELVLMDSIVPVEIYNAKLMLQLF